MGQPPSPIDPSPGCPFAPRCPYRMERCGRRAAQAGAGGRTSGPQIGVLPAEGPSESRPGERPARRSRRSRGTKPVGDGTDQVLSPGAEAGTVMARPELTEEPLLRLHDVVKHFPVRSGTRLGRQEPRGGARGRPRQPRPAPGRDAGACVGETGCGKSTLGARRARAAARGSRPAA